MIPALKSDQFLCEICGLSRVAFTVFARGARWRRLHRLCELQKREREGRRANERAMKKRKLPALRTVPRSISLARDLGHHRSLVPSWRSSEMPAWPCPRCYFMNCLQTLQNIRQHRHRQTYPTAFSRAPLHHA